MDIKIDDLTGSDVAELLSEHIQSMKLHSPPESKHALDLEALRKPEITLDRKSTRLNSSHRT